MKLINLIEKNLKTKSKIKFLNIQKGDVVKTHASTKYLKKKLILFQKLKLKQGLKYFVNGF